jgi:orotidine-5'-phosphate decarboxylase
VLTPPQNRLIVALDRSDLSRAESLARALGPSVGMLKIGLELFMSHGPAAVREIRRYGTVFLDVKLHDIPTTVGRAARGAATLGIEALTVHALGGPDMVRAAVEGATEGAEIAGHAPPRIIAVTVLSSLAGESLASPGSLAFEAVSAGAFGAVVSGEDVALVREALGDEPALVVPGIRPAGQEANDHVRVLTPREAVEAGADFLVVGRPITDAMDPAAVARAVLSQLPPASPSSSTSGRG